ncbi:uncharacterized protein DC041_0002698, partial [Schistosoma bovis]
NIRFLLFVFTGKCDCPFYARIELLADKLSLNLPSFRVTKIVKQPQDWKEFTKWITEKHGWFVEESPVVWRELVDQGGKGILIGGANEFQELVAAYYGEQISIRTDEMLNVMKNNIKYKIQEDQEQQMKIINTPSPSNVVVIGAAGLGTGDFLASILNGKVFGDEMIELYLSDEVKNKNKLFELREVLEEAALPKLSRVHISDDVDECLTHAKQVVILDVIPRKGPSFSDIRIQDEWEQEVTVCSLSGWYGVPEGIAFSFPVMCGSYGYWWVVEDMPLTPEVETQLKTSIRSVLEDWAVVDPLPLEDFLKKEQKPKYNYNEYQAENNEEN